MKRIFALTLTLFVTTSLFAEEAEIKTGDPVPAHLLPTPEQKAANNAMNLLRKLGLSAKASDGRLTTIEDALAKLVQATQTISSSEARLKALEDYVASVEKDSSEVLAAI